MMIARGDNEKTEEELDEEAEERWEDESPAPEPNPNIVPPESDDARDNAAYRVAKEDRGNTAIHFQHY